MKVELTRGERFKDARLEHNVHGKQTMEQVEAAASVSKALISSIENDKAGSVGSEYVVSLARHYNVTTDYLLGLSDVPTTKEDIKIACKTTGLSAEAIKQLSFTKPNDVLAKGLGFRGEFDSFISRYSLDIAVRLSQLHYAIEKAEKDISFLENTPVTADNWEQLFDIAENAKRNLVLEVFEFSELFRRAQETLFPTGLVVDKLTSVQRSIHKPKEAANNAE